MSPTLSDAARELGKWPRDLYAEAVWCSAALKPVQKLVALAYADHARDGDTAWLSYERLAERTGLARSTAAAALRQLVDAGWLVCVERGRQHRASRYRLELPQQSESRTPEQSDSRTPDSASSPAPDTSSPAADTSSPAAGPDLSTYLRTNLNTVREGEAVIVQPEDREPASSASLADRLRGLGVAWPDRDVRLAHARLYALLGSDVRAEGQANAVLTELAKRRRPVLHLTSWLSMLDDDAVLALPEVTSLPGRGRTPAPRPARLPTPAEDADIARRRQLLDEHPHGQAARAEARRSIPDVPAPPTEARVDRDAELLLRDPSWIAEQQEHAA